MADTRTLRFIGLAYGVLAAAVGLIAVVVVSGHVFGTMTLDDARNPAVEMSASRR
jgi:hypothetical protein